MWGWAYNSDCLTVYNDDLGVILFATSCASVVERRFGGYTYRLCPVWGREIVEGSLFRRSSHSQEWTLIFNTVSGEVSERPKKIVRNLPDWF